MKKHLFLTALVLLSMLSIPLHASVQIGDLYYDLDATTLTAEVTHPQKPIFGSSSYTGLESAIIPTTVTYNGYTYSVTTIGDDAFLQCGLASVTIPNSVTSIGDDAFYGCYGLASVTIPNSVTSIGDNAFYSVRNIIYSGTATGSPWGACCINGYIDSCLVYKDTTKTTLLFCFNTTTGAIIIPNSVTSIGERAFYNCSGITSITIPNSVTSIGEQAFYDCSSLASVTIGNSVTSIGNVFGGCTKISSVVWNAINCSGWSSSYTSPFYSAKDSITSFTFGDNVKTIPSYLCYGMSKLTSITIPNNATTIGSDVFGGCTKISSVVWNAINCSGWSSSYTSPFYSVQDNITSFTIGDKEETIPSYLCYGMSKLTSIAIPNNVTSIGQSAFYNCFNLTLIYLPNSVTSIEKDAFYGCSGLTSITIPEGITYICKDAFKGCKDAFKGCKDAFKGCSHITFIRWNAKVCPNLRESLHIYSPFDDIASNITSFTLGNKVEQIPAYLCSNMENVTSITIPNSVTSIGDGAFNNCTGLKYISIPNTVTTADPYILENCTALDTIILPAGFCDISQWVEGWGTINAWEYAPQALVYAELNGGTITDNATGLLKCSSKTLLTLDLRQTDNTTLPDEAFRGCYNLQTLLLPNNLTSIPYKAAAECASLQSITIPAGVQEIGDRAFAECSKMQSITSYAVTPPTIQAKTFSEVDRSIPIYVPAQSLNDYKTAEYWEEFFNIQAVQSASPVENVYSADRETPSKVLIDGQVCILRNGKTYTLTGAIVKNKK